MTYFMVFSFVFVSCGLLALSLVRRSQPEDLDTAPQIMSVGSSRQETGQAFPSQAVETSVVWESRSAMIVSSRIRSCVADRCPVEVVQVGHEPQQSEHRFGRNLEIYAVEHAVGSP